MRIHESQTGGLTKSTPTRWRARLIEGDVWGSSGFYSREVLEKFGPSTWPSGTPIFLDHPTITEDAERPVRSVKDLAGKTVSTPAYENDGLYADIEFYAHVAPSIAAMAEDVGMSIRATAEVEAGEAAGRSGWIITSLSEGRSVDVVTAAGAGGKLVAALEAARPRAVIESLPDGVTYEAARDLLNAAIKTDTGTWVMDFDDSTVIYSADDTNGASTYYRQGYTLTADATTLTGDRVEVKPRTIYEPITGTGSPAPLSVPADPAGQTKNATESVKGTLMATIQIEETAHAALVEKAGRVEALESQLTETTTQRDTAMRAVEEAHREADHATARAIIAAAEHYSFNELEVAGLLASLPVAESGRLDAATFTATVTEAAAKAAVAAGAGRVFGHGGSPSGGMTLDDFDKQLAEMKGI